MLSMHDKDLFRWRRPTWWPRGRWLSTVKNGHLSVAACWHWRHNVNTEFGMIFAYKGQIGAVFNSHGGRGHCIEMIVRHRNNNVWQLPPCGTRWQRVRFECVTEGTWCTGRWWWLISTSWRSGGYPPQTGNWGGLTSKWKLLVKSTIDRSDNITRLLWGYSMGVRWQFAQRNLEDTCIVNLVSSTATSSSSVRPHSSVVSPQASEPNNAAWDTITCQITRDLWPRQEASLEEYHR